jgi:hypothetical protein
VFIFTALASRLGVAELRAQKKPVRTEPVEVPEHPEPASPFVLSPSKEVPLRRIRGFDRLSPNGMGFVFGAFVFPITLSLSKGRLSPNGMGFVFRLLGEEHRNARALKLRRQTKPRPH